MNEYATKVPGCFTMSIREALHVIEQQCGIYARIEPKLDYATIGNIARAALANGPVVVGVTVKHEPDPCPDVSYLGEYSNIPGPADRTIDRATRATGRYYNAHRECRYFIAAVSGEESGNPESVELDYQRMEAYRNQQWCMWGIVATAKVQISIGNGYSRIERLSTGGIWGIESDANAALIAGIKQDELNNLRDLLMRFGVDLSKFDELAGG